MKNQANWSCWPVEKKVEGNPCLLCKAVNTDSFVKSFVTVKKSGMWLLWISLSKFFCFRCCDLAHKYWYIDYCYRALAQLLCAKQSNHSAESIGVYLRKVKQAISTTAARFSGFMQHVSYQICIMLMVLLQRKSSWPGLLYNQSINQSISQSFNQSINQSINQSSSIRFHLLCIIQISRQGYWRADIVQPCPFFINKVYEFHSHLYCFFVKVAYERLILKSH